TLAESLTRYGRPATRAAADLDTLSLTVASSAVDLAYHRNLALWSDDPFLRVAARRVSVTAFSTPAALDLLFAEGTITAARHEIAARLPVKERTGAIPFTETRLLELAEDDQWHAGPVASVLGRPASWIDTPRALRLFSLLIRLAQAHNADAVPAWVYHAVQGA